MLIIINPAVKSNTTAVPATSRACLSSFRPSAKLKFEAAPIPTINPIAIQIVVIGKAIFVAAFPKYPTPCPIKIWSTIL